MSSSSVLLDLVPQQCPIAASSSSLAWQIGLAWQELGLADLQELSPAGDSRLHISDKPSIVATRYKDARCHSHCL